MVLLMKSFLKMFLTNSAGKFILLLSVLFNRSTWEWSNLTLVKPRLFNFLGIQMKYKEFTMIPRKVYLDNLYLARKFAPKNGCVIEAGAWRGGMIRGLVDVLGTKHYSFHIFDSFEGLPKAKEIDGQAAISWQANKDSPTYYNNCTAEMDVVDKLFSNVNGNYSIYPGWFENTLGDFVSNDKIAILRLDADWYDATMLCLKSFWDKMNPRGLIILDDYGTWDGCKKAVDDFLLDKAPNIAVRRTRIGTHFITLRDL